MIPDQLSIVANGKTVTGWQDIIVTRSLEQFPSSFDITCTEIVSESLPPLLLQPQAQCQIKLGNDLVLTGYIDTYTADITSDSHTIRIIGRSKCEDFHDCSAGMVGMPTTNLLTLAQKLAAPYGITVSKQGNWTEVLYPALSVNLTQTGYQIVEMVARYSGVMVYDGTDGNLIIAGVGNGQMASGFIQGQNIEQANMSFSFSQRYSKITAVWQSIDTMESLASNISGVAVDPEVNRFRPLIIQSEQAVESTNYAQIRATWEVNRRRGRSLPIKIITSGWRDSAGSLWEINKLVNVSIPKLHIENVNWLIASVSFRKDLHRGTTTELVIMEPDAFTVEPISPLSGLGPLAGNAGVPSLGAGAPLT